MIAALWSLFLGSALAGDASPLWIGQGTPWTVGDGNVAFGLFSPVHVGLSDKVELQTSGLLTLAVPNVGVKAQVLGDESRALAVYGRAWVPTFGLRAQKGWTTPTNRTIPLAVTGTLGVVGGLSGDTWTASAAAELRAGVAGSTWDVGPTDAPFFDSALAPLTEGLRAVVKANFDYFPGRHEGYTDQLGLRVDTSVHLGGAGLDAYLRAVGTYRVGRHVGLSAGVIGGIESYGYGRSPVIAPIVDVGWRF